MRQRDLSGCSVRKERTGSIDWTTIRTPRHRDPRRSLARRGWVRGEEGATMIHRRGEKHRTRLTVVLTTVGALVVFQALAIVGAGMALAATCNYNLSNDTVTVDLPPGDIADIRVNDGVIEVEGTPCGSATNSNTTAIVVLGENGSNEEFIIDESFDEPFNTAIAWSIDLGTDTSDQLTFQLNGDQDNTLVLTDASFNPNGAVGELAGVERFSVFGGDGDDTIDGSGTSNFMNVLGDDGDDVISPGTFDGDSLFGQGDDDTLSYATRTACVFVQNSNDAGNDLNCDGDNDDPGDEEDTLFGCFEAIVTGSNNDTINDGVCNTTTFAPGEGDDDIVGDGDNDTLDLSSSTAGVVIDADAQTATGQGTDTWTELDNFIGSNFDDTLLLTGDAPGQVDRFSGLDGVDLVDASAATAGVDVELDVLDPDGDDDLENLIGSAFNDELDGNDLRNQIRGGAGDDQIEGDEANDTLFGGEGNDSFDGGPGADTVSFVESAAGVTVDLSLLFASGEGDDSFVDTIEIIVGSNQNDSITGGPFSGGGTVNFLFKGKAGGDNLTGFNGNDTLNGGKGPDTLRGVGGDDTLLGKKGNDTLAGGNGFDIGKGGPGNDVCQGVEQAGSCV